MFQAEFRLESRHLCAHHGANTRAIGEEKVDQGDIVFVIFLCDPQAVLVEETEFRNRVVVGVSLCSSIGAEAFSSVHPTNVRQHNRAKLAALMVLMLFSLLIMISFKVNLFFQQGNVLHQPGYRVASASQKVVFRVSIFTTDMPLRIN